MSGGLIKHAIKIKSNSISNVVLNLNLNMLEHLHGCVCEV